MNSSTQLVKYKKVSFLEKIKNKIVNFFFKKENIDKNVKGEDVVINKENFFEIYEKVKKQKLDIQTLDKETIRKILIIVNEEIKINNKKIEQKLKTLEISLDNIKIYDKEIELLRKSANS